MGSASFRNCAFTLIPKSWPTFSSGDILRNVLAAHFCPALLTWMGPGCRKRSLLLSLPKQSAAASSSVISRRCRSMQMTIARSRNVLKNSVWFSILGSTAAHPGFSAIRSDDLRTYSNVPFDDGDAFPLNGRLIAKTRQPMHTCLPTKPCDLALGVITMRLLCRRQRRLPIHFAAQELYCLLVS